MAKGEPKASRPVHVVLRFDDPSAVSPTDLERAIVQDLRRRGMSATLGVIPFVCSRDIADPSEQLLLPLPEEKLQGLRQAVAEGVVEVALHGYAHQTSARGKRTEFAGLAAEEQLRLLFHGKATLEAGGLGPVRTFIPPWNAYDSNTLRALEETGFQAISADWKGTAQPAHRLRFVPATTGLGRLRDAVSAARRAPDLNPLVVALFHPYDFDEVDTTRGTWTREDFAKLLDWLAAQPDVRVLSIAQALDAIPDLGADRLRALAAWRDVQSATPIRLREAVPALVYREASAHSRALRRLLALYAALCTALLGTAISAWKLASGASGTGRWSLALALILCAGAAAYGLWGLGMSPGALRAALSTRTKGRADSNPGGVG